LRAGGGAGGTAQLFAFTQSAIVLKAPLPSVSVLQLPSGGLWHENDGGGGGGGGGGGFGPGGGGGGGPGGGAGGSAHFPPFHRQRGAVQLCCVLMDAQGVAALLQGVHEPVTLPQCVSAPQHQRFAPLLQQTGCSLSQQ
jgi:hypothetical protein